MKDEKEEGENKVWREIAGKIEWKGQGEMKIEGLRKVKKDKTKIRIGKNKFL